MQTMPETAYNVMKSRLMIGANKPNYEILLNGPGGSVCLDTDPPPPGTVLYSQDFTNGLPSDFEFDMPGYTIETSDPPPGFTHYLKYPSPGDDAWTRALKTHVATKPFWVRFWYKTSCEFGYDNLYFSIDNYSYMNMSGNSGWKYYESYVTNPGTHEIRWGYLKDGSSFEYGDTIYIGGIEIIESYQNATSFAGGDGTAENPYLVSNAEQLRLVDSYKTSHFKQTANIDLSGYSNWRPIGLLKDQEFQGFYDGDNFSISNMKVDNINLAYIVQANGTGLFGQMVKKNNIQEVEFVPTIKNVNLPCFEIITNYYAGGLIGSACAGEILNCHVWGTIDIYGLLLADSVGGFIGDAGYLADWAHEILFEDCSAEVTITAKYMAEYADYSNSYFEMTGGFIGYAVNLILTAEPITFRNCCSNVTYEIEPGTGTKSRYIGGFVGYTGGNYGLIVFEECFAYGSVCGDDRIGGFAGYSTSRAQFHNCFTTCDLTSKNILTTARAFGGFTGAAYGSTSVEYINCYAANTFSKVTPGFLETKVKGFVGEYLITNPVFSGLYFDYTLNPRTDDVATEKTTAEMKQQSTFIDWNFSTIWAINPAINEGYPYLINTVCAEIPTGGNYLDGILTININKGSGGSNQAALTVDNKAGGRRDLLNLNDLLIIRLGYGADLVNAYTGMIDAIRFNSFGQEIEVATRDILKGALDQMITMNGLHTIEYTDEPIETIVTHLAGLAGMTIDVVEETGITISKVFSFQSYGDCFQLLADLSGFEYGATENGTFYFRRDNQPDDAVIAYSFEEGIDILTVGLELNDQDLFRTVLVYGKSGETIISYQAAFLDAAEYNVLSQKVLKIDATEATTIAELRKIAERAIYLMRSRTKVVEFETVGNPWLQVGDFIQVFESSSNSAGIYRISAISLYKDNIQFTMRIKAYYYGGSVVLGELPEETPTQTPNPSLNLIPEMTSNNAPSGVCRASSVYILYSNDYGPWNAFNSTSDDLFWDASVNHGWIEYQFTENLIVDKYMLKARQLVEYNYSMPKNWTFEAFDGDTWIVLDTRTNQTGWGIHETREYLFANTNAYSKYRLNVSGNNGYVRLQLEQLAMYYGGGS